MVDSDPPTSPRSRRSITTSATCPRTIFPGSITLKPFHRLTSDDFLHDYCINCLGAVAALPSLKAAPRASIVLLSTVAVPQGMPFHTSISIMHKEIVDRRRWLSEDHFLHVLNFCMLPGPEAQQLATYLGWRVHGARGSIAAGGVRSNRHHRGSRGCEVYPF